MNFCGSFARSECQNIFDSFRNAGNGRYPSNLKQFDLIVRNENILKNKIRHLLGV